MPDASVRQIDPALKPRLPRGVRLKHDEVRGEWVLLAPERMLKLNPVSVEILKRCTGDASLAEIVDDLAKAFAAPRRADRDRCRGHAGRTRPQTPGRPMNQHSPRSGAASGRAPGRTDASLSARLSLLLQPGRARNAGRRTLDRRVAAGLLRSRGARHPSGPSLGRRAGEPARPRRDRDPLRHARPLHQPDHFRDRPHPAPDRRPVRGRPRPCPIVDPGHRRGDGRHHRRLRGRVAPQERRCGRGDPGRVSADRQRCAASGQHRPCGRAGRKGHRARRTAGRDRARAILRLGEEQPGRPHAHTGRGPRGHCRGRAPEGRSTPARS